jgi:hypothetical protein
MKQMTPIEAGLDRFLEPALLATLAESRGSPLCAVRHGHGRSWQAGVGRKSDHEPSEVRFRDTDAPPNTDDRQMLLGKQPTHGPGVPDS